MQFVTLLIFYFQVKIKNTKSFQYLDSYGNRRFDGVNDKLSVKNCVSKNLTFPKKSHQRAKTS